MLIANKHKLTFTPKAGAVVIRITVFTLNAVGDVSESLYIPPDMAEAKTSQISPGEFEGNMSEACFDLGVY